MPGEADITFDYGPGTFNLLAPVSRLSDLAAYRSTLIMSFTGTEAGEPSEWSNTYEMITTGANGSSGSFSYQPRFLNRRRYHGNGQ